MKPSIFRYEGHNYQVPFLIISSLFFGGQLLFSGVNIAIPYALVGIFVLSVALILSRITLPDPRRAHEADTNEKIEEKPMKTMASAFGMLTLFLYVAAQTGVNSFFINYAEESIHIEKQTASAT